MSEVFFDEYENIIIKRLGGHVFADIDDEPRFRFKKYGLTISVRKGPGRFDYFCEVTSPDIPVKVIANGGNIIHAIAMAMDQVQRTMRPYIMTDAAAKFLDDDIKKEFHYDREDS